MLVSVVVFGCQSAQYKALEKVGIEKRDIMTDRVEDARDAQDDAKEQFVSALEQFRATVEFDGGDLERLYDRLNREYERSVADAEEVTARINSIERVAQDLFEEWEGELDQYQSASLRGSSQELLRDTQSRYRRMLTSMRNAEATMPPVLEAFEDQVLFLKHNLNSRAISAMRDELGSIENETDALVAAMEASIAEANQFIDSIQQG
ncbi:MAG: DUF2959 domain-containing protein [Pseudomonadota bacterium]